MGMVKTTFFGADHFLLIQITHCGDRSAWIEATRLAPDFHWQLTLDLSHVGWRGRLHRQSVGLGMAHGLHVG